MGIDKYARIREAIAGCTSVYNTAAEVYKDTGQCSRATWVEMELRGAAKVLAIHWLRQFYFQVGRALCRSLKKACSGGADEYAPTRVECRIGAVEEAPARVECRIGAVEEAPTRLRCRIGAVEEAPARVECRLRVVKYTPA
jgi:hypothetical protein